MIKEKKIVKSYRVNESIRTPKVFVIDETGQKIGIIPTHEALSMAKDRNLDLVEVAPSSSPPVCRVMDYGKFIYEQEKQLKKQKAQKKFETKEIRIGPQTGEHDLEVKRQHSEKLLKDGYPLQITMKLMGRQMKFKDRSIDNLKEFAQNLASGMVESGIKREGNRFSMRIHPVKK